MLSPQKYLFPAGDVAASAPEAVPPPEDPLHFRSLPSERQVQDKLQQESKKIRQQVRTKQASKRSNKSGGKKARQRTQGALV